MVWFRLILSMTDILSNTIIGVYLFLRGLLEMTFESLNERKRESQHVVGLPLHLFSKGSGYTL